MKKKLKLYWVLINDDGTLKKDFVLHKKKKLAITYALGHWDCGTDAVGVGQRVKIVEPGILEAPPEVETALENELRKLMSKQFINSL